MSKLGKDPFTNAQYVKVALKFAYNGRKYYGFEKVLDKAQTNSITIEDKLFEAMSKVTMIKPEGSPLDKDLDYSKAGRTDAGVSAMGNVISLKIRKITGRLRFTQMSSIVTAR